MQIGNCTPDLHKNAPKKIPEVMQIGNWIPVLHKIIRARSAWCGGMLNVLNHDFGVSGMPPSVNTVASFFLSRRSFRIWLVRLMAAEQ